MNGETLANRQWQPDSWFPAAGKDSAGGLPGAQLAARMDAIRRLLPLPLEQILAPDITALTFFAAKIRNAAANAEVISLAHCLTSRELNLIFPTLAILTPGNRSDAQLVDRLNLLIRERACPTLYLSGWLAFQKHYPSRTLARSLNILCQILAIRQQTGPTGAPADDLASQATDELAGQPADQPYGQPAPPLISLIVPPVSRQMIRRLIRYLDSEEQSLTDFMHLYQIQAKLPFGAELIAQTFINGDSSIYRDGHHLYATALQEAGQSTQAALLRHFFQLKDLAPNVRNRYCQQIYRQYGDPAGDNPIWLQLQARDRRLFRAWVFAATIGSHCRQQPAKARLYQRYAAGITRIERWDDNTLLIHFPEFLIADSCRSPLLAIYYRRSAATEKHPFELANPEFCPNPADPAIPRRQVEDAIRNGNIEGIIGLPFDPAGIRLTSTFLDLVLSNRQRSLLRRIGNWLGDLR